MKVQYLLLIACLLVACKSKHTKPGIDSSKIKKLKVLPASYNMSNRAIQTNADTSEIDEQRDAYADYYVVIADTGLNYYSLRDKMFELNHATGVGIDTMDQYYDKQKDLIKLPDNYDDDILAGQYVMRRYPSKTLSLEYLQSYKNDSDKKMIALVTGIYENKSSADSALKALQPISALSIKSKIYIGCIH
ncbi:hypothetical protein SAMN05192574_108221 [Mucilaginibacter gossypiicola]|uniref:Uncharacterized protein n=1 Tax=Mucilaginibacter gossypiicola TaxID=551995 RepID=A0A1H8Q1K8_9SPHI|nr:hypothetical protein [Mucilaginibacter gossypiicola]SEO47663.1 hypothetical protein SAMN05192574_108221 [Mucilaginibacter gossypiicola]